MGFGDVQFSSYEPVPRGIWQFRLEKIETVMSTPFGGTDSSAKVPQFAWHFIGVNVNNSHGNPCKLTHYTSCAYGNPKSGFTKTMDGILGLRLTQPQWDSIKNTLDARLVGQDFMVNIDIIIGTDGNSKNKVNSIYRPQGWEFPVMDWIKAASGGGFGQAPAQQPVQQPAQQFGQAPAPLDAAPPGQQPQQQFGAPQQPPQDGFGQPPAQQAPPPQGGFGTPPAQGFGEQQPAAFIAPAQNNYVQQNGISAPVDPFTGN